MGIIERAAKVLDEDIAKMKQKQQVKQQVAKETTENDKKPSLL
jgi:hypothetical protein